MVPATAAAVTMMVSATAAAAALALAAAPVVAAAAWATPAMVLPAAVVVGSQLVAALGLQLAGWWLRLLRQVGRRRVFCEGCAMTQALSRWLCWAADSRHYLRGHSDYAQHTRQHGEAVFLLAGTLSDSNMLRVV
jgi:hypothetical protein